MAHPKRRQSVMRRDKRRSHDFLTPPELVTCNHCGAAVLKHRICGECGYYRGKQAVEIKGEA
ncbi:MAG TPA: 50S ribosomal protein L32 [Bacteroidales bacterium]|jgi:large subunit ribosomal protein L32|nr:50S ribosomal protein L32 [Bacteroidales bacterium]HOF45418.1 50S ribosomal protein L32 [Bacteroidales bacterium]HOS57794.1 50S ribosomal protein L32 [Bacteroidales bacterium]HPY80809.1 50S ribosomal protein L32 [Bacteroidales bacterium]HQA87365.1 50S ribosomal protein L32 [Bacteroidales bacterium]